MSRHHGAARRREVLRGALASALAVGLVTALGCPEAGSDGAGSPGRTPAAGEGVAGWSPDELALLRSLSISSLPPPPPAPSNRVADDPRAARLGHRLFFDPALSADGSVSCATCHDPERHFTDGRPRSRGLGETARNAPSVVASAWSPFLFWDGRRDSLWSQALSPLEAPEEMGSTRLEVVRHVTGSPATAERYAELFGPPPDFAADGWPARAGPRGDAAARDAWSRLDADQRRAVNRAFANVGKAIAAYERRLRPGPAPFDRYVERLLAGDAAGAAEWLDPDAVAGLRLFVDGERGRCLRCHNGPLLTNQAFHDVATARLGDVPDLGRSVGIQALLLSEWNCLGPYSDASPAACAELRFLDRRRASRAQGAFKTPTLREVARTGPYLHDGSLATLEAVVEHYRAIPEESPSELLPLAIEDAEADRLAAFLRMLSGGVAGDAIWRRPPDDFLRPPEASRNRMAAPTPP